MKDKYFVGFWFLVGLSTVFFVTTMMFIVISKDLAETVIVREEYISQVEEICKYE